MIKVISFVFAVGMTVNQFSYAADISSMRESSRAVKNSDATITAPVKFDFQSANVSQIINLVYLEAFKQAYVIDPAVLKDDRLVSFRFDSSKADLRAFWTEFMSSLGFQVEPKNGVDYLSVKKQADEVKASHDVFVYRPQFRSVSYISGALSPLFSSGGFTVNRVVHVPGNVKPPPNNAPSTSAAALLDQDSDILIFQGTQDEIKLLKKMLPQIDFSSGEVMVKAIVYEVSTSKSDGSAFTLALNILNGRFGVNLSASPLIGNSVSLKAGSIESAFSILSGDTRFNAISTPSLRVRSGATARLTVGQDVPTLGAVSYSSSNAQPVQSIEYRSSGVILELSPTVKDSVIDLRLDQQISDFAKTETGVNTSPTLTKRQLSTSISAQNGEMILIGGLSQDKDSRVNSGLPFLPQRLHSKNDSGSRTELLLLIQVMRIENSKQ